MTERGAPPEWLEAFQARFSAMLRTALDRSSGTLREEAAAYPSALCAEMVVRGGIAATERLAVYNRQYWFRFFTVLQGEFPLTSRLLGAWSFNAHAARFLEEQPPRTHDLACIADGFADFLEQTQLADRAIVQAARIDDAYRLVFRAPQQRRFTPSPSDAALLSSRRLEQSAAARLVEEDWPLLELRSMPSHGERPVRLPAPHAERRFWMICRTTEGTRAMPLELLAGKLLRLLERWPLERALAELESDVAEDDRPALATSTQRWLAEGIRLGYWTGLAP